MWRHWRRRPHRRMRKEVSDKQQCKCRDMPSMSAATFLALLTRHFESTWIQDSEQEKLTRLFVDARYLNCSLERTGLESSVIIELRQSLPHFGLLQPQASASGMHVVYVCKVPGESASGISLRHLIWYNSELDLRHNDRNASFRQQSCKSTDRSPRPLLLTPSRVVPSVLKYCPRDIARGLRFHVLAEEVHVIEDASLVCPRQVAVSPIYRCRILVSFASKGWT